MIKGRIKIPSTYSRSSLVIALQKLLNFSSTTPGTNWGHTSSAKSFLTWSHWTFVTESSVTFPTPSIFLVRKTETFSRNPRNICNSFNASVSSRTEPIQKAMWPVNSRSKRFTSSPLNMAEGSNSWSLQDLQKSPQNWHCYIVPRTHAVDPCQLKHQPGCGKHRNISIENDKSCGM